MFGVITNAFTPAKNSTTSEYLYMLEPVSPTTYVETLQAFKVPNDMACLKFL